MHLPPRRPVRFRSARLRSVCLLAGALLPMGTSVVWGQEGSRAEEAVTFLELLAFGREVNLVLGVLLFLAVFLVIRVVLLTRKALTVPPELLRGVLDDLASGDVEGAQRRAEGRPSLLAFTILPGLRVHDHPAERIHIAMEGAGRRALGSIRQQVTYLANVGVLAPMLGLLGTVLGLTKAFHVIGQDATEATRTSLMTASIGEAMGTTAVGLVVGIAAMAAHYLCQSRVARIGDDVELAAEDVYAALAALGQGREGQA